MKRTTLLLIAIVAISATLAWSIRPCYAQTRPRVVGQKVPARVVVVETRPRRATRQKKQIQIPTSEQFVDKLHRLVDQYFRPVNR